MKDPDHDHRGTERHDSRALRIADLGHRVVETDRIPAETTPTGSASSLPSRSATAASNDTLFGAENVTS